MFSTLSQGCPGCKNNFGRGGYYFQSDPKLLWDYYFTGAFTGGWFDKIARDFAVLVESAKIWSGGAGSGKLIMRVRKS
jgi:hypothetical protein